MNRLIIVTIILCTLLIGCAGSVNLLNARKYELAGRDAINKGDYKTASINYSRAWENANLGEADARYIARLRYEYGRASGVICKWDEAELALLEAYELDVKHNGPLWMSLVELERLSLAQKNYKKAITYFEELIPIIKGSKLELRDPLGCADVYDEYALALNKIGDSEKAKKYTNRAKQIQATFPGEQSYSQITPYGTQCN